MGTPRGERCVVDGGDLPVLRRMCGNWQIPEQLLLLCCPSGSTLLSNYSNNQRELISLFTEKLCTAVQRSTCASKYFFFSLQKSCFNENCFATLQNKNRGQTNFKAGKTKIPQPEAYTRCQQIKQQVQPIGYIVYLVCISTHPQTIKGRSKFTVQSWMQEVMFNFVLTSFPSSASPPTSSAPEGLFSFFVAAASATFRSSLFKWKNESFVLNFFVREEKFPSVGIRTCIMSRKFVLFK